MDTNIFPDDKSGPAVHLDGTTVTIGNLSFSSDLIAGHLATVSSELHAEEIVRAMEIGVHALAASTMRATVDEMQREVQRIITTASDAALTQLGEAMRTGKSELSAHLDPEVRSSLTARAVAELEELHKKTLSRLDPDRNGSHTSKLIASVTEMLGPGGMLAQRLDEAFDTNEVDNGLGRLRDTFEKRFQEMRDLLVGEQHRRDEAERGTAKGFEFEDIIDSLLRSEARAMSGCIVERTGHLGGTLGAHSKVGDFVVTLDDGTRIAIEAKNTSRIGLTGTTGILNELDEAVANRGATWAICISRTEAFPGEVGTFGIYGNRLLVVDGGEGLLTRAALRWIAAAGRASSADSGCVDTASALDKLERIRGLAQSFSRSKKVLNSAQAGIDTVRGELDSLRNELLELVDDASRILNPPVAHPRQVA